MGAPPSSIASLATDLLQTLQHEQARFEDLLELLAQEHHCIASLSLRELDSMTVTKLALLNEIQALEKTRHIIIGRLAASWDCPSESLTLRLIADRIGGQTGHQLRERQKRLSGLLEAIHASNEVTRTVIMRFLDLLHQVIKLCSASPVSIPLYGSSASILSSGSGTTLLDQKG